MNDWFWKLLTLEMRLSFHDYRRACGQVPCEVCGRLLIRHPELFDYMQTPPEFTGLVLLCNGDLVHL